MENAVVLFRNHLQLEGAMSLLSEEEISKIQPVVPDPGVNQESTALVTFGSSLPQSEMLRALLQERPKFDVD
jgi:hypothetical protein